MDAIGLNFAPISQRRIDVDRGAEIARACADVARVGLFADQEPVAVRRIVDAVELDVLQFHGREPADYCAQFGLPFVKAIAMSGRSQRVEPDVRAAVVEYAAACALLLDSAVDGAFGGTGVVFDWRTWPGESTETRLVLAGGLDPDNVADAIFTTRPYAVDVSSGIETPGRKGIKDAARMTAFVEAVRRADARIHSDTEV